MMRPDMFQLDRLRRLDNNIILLEVVSNQGYLVNNADAVLVRVYKLSQKKDRARWQGVKR
jgi:hypothetical protein